MSAQALPIQGTSAAGNIFWGDLQVLTKQGEIRSLQLSVTLSSDYGIISENTGGLGGSCGFELVCSPNKHLLWAFE